MTQARKDENSEPTMLGTADANGTATALIYADPASHSIQADDDTTGTDLSGDVAARDNNGISVIMAVSSADGSTPVAVYVTTDNKIKVNSN